jgi:hypothetical protein
MSRTIASIGRNGCKEHTTTVFFPITEGSRSQADGFARHQQNRPRVLAFGATLTYKMQ